MDFTNRMAVTVSEAAECLAISESKLYQLLAARQLQFFKIGRSTRISITELQRFIAELQAEQESAEWS